MGSSIPVYFCERKQKVIKTGEAWEPRLMYTSFEYCQLVHSTEGSLSRHARILDCASNEVWLNVTITIWTKFSVEMGSVLVNVTLINQVFNLVTQTLAYIKYIHKHLDTQNLNRSLNYSYASRDS